MKKNAYLLVAILIIGIWIVSCKPKSGSPVAEPAFTPTKMLTASGTEPGWIVLVNQVKKNIYEADITYAYGQEKYKTTVTKLEGTNLGYIGQIDRAGQKTEVYIAYIAQNCMDMAEKNHPLTVTLKIGDEIHYGCGD